MKSKVKSARAASGQSVYLTVPEAVLYTNLSKAEVLNRIALGRYLTIIDGKRKKVIRQSIDDDTNAELKNRRETQRKGKAA